jgi:hypothetical protein
MEVGSRMRSWFLASHTGNSHRGSQEQTEHARKYAYDMLATSTTFQILALESGTGNEPLQGQLLHVDVQSFRRSSFMALFYVLGDPPADRLFHCRSSTTSGILHIAQSLEEVLKRFDSDMVRFTSGQTRFVSTKTTFKSAPIRSA